MINEEVRHIIEAELQEGEKLLWFAKSSLELLKRKNILIHSILALIVIGVVVYIMLVQRNSSMFQFGFVLLIVLGTITFQTFRAFRLSTQLSKNIYAVTDGSFIIIGYNDDTGTKFVERTSFDNIKRVHEMKISGGASISLIFKGGVLPNTKGLVINGLPEDTKLADILNKKLNYL